MVRVGRACPYCHSPAWRNPCWWIEDRRVSVGADPPCACDDYGREVARVERRKGLTVAFLVGALILVLSISLWSQL